jgi:hypothetical protein
MGAPTMSADVNGHPGPIDSRPDVAAVAGAAFPGGLDIDPGLLAAATPWEAFDGFRRAGFWAVLIYPKGAVVDGKVKQGKDPIGKEWGVAPWTRTRAEQTLARHPGAGVGLCLGPDRAPGGRWLADIEGDGPEAEESRATLFGGEVVETMGWGSTRGGHQPLVIDPDRLGAVLPGLSDFEVKGGPSKGVYKFPELPGLEIRLGGYKPEPDGTVKQVQSVIPPTVGTDDAPRAWSGPPRIVEAPEAFYAFLGARAAEGRLERERKAEARRLEREARAARRAASGPGEGEGEGGDAVEALVADRVRRYAEAALAHECLKVRDTREGGRHDTLRAASLKVAGLVAAAVLDEHAYRAEFGDAAAARGLPETDAVDLIEGALTLATPRDLGEVRDAIRVKLLGRRERAADVAANGDGHHAADLADDVDPVIVDRWPRMDEAAYRGIVGEIVRMAAPETEADPVAILIQLLVGFGSALGRTVYWTAGATRHYCVLFAALVGATASARKGSAWDVVEFLLACLDETWSTRRVVGGLSSGEGLIYHVRDRVTRPGKDGGEAEEVDPGEVDKRLACVEREFGRTLKTMAAPYNTLSSVLRQCWDCPSRLGTLTKTSTNVATGAHVSVIAHITNQELLALLSEIDSAGGLGNRFLWLCVRKSRPLPHGGRFHDLPWGPLQLRLRAAFEQARGYTRVELDAEARRAWEDAYGLLTRERAGLLGLMLARAEAQVRRIATIYALLEGRREVGMGHLESALAVWDYCESSAKFIFGQTLGDADAEKLLAALRRAPEGLTRTQIVCDVFQKNKSKVALTGLLDRLFNLGVIHRVSAPTGRPGPVPERWLCGREQCNQT